MPHDLDADPERNEMTDETPAPDNEFARAAEAANEVRHKIFALRGEIVSEVNSLEGFVDMALCLYFNQEHPFTTRFRSWLLSRIQFSAKLDVVGQITSELGVKDRMHGTVTRLKKANDLRNNVAHSSVTFNPNVREISRETAAEFFRWHSHRESREGSRITRVEIEELERDAAFVKSVGGEIVRLLVVATAPGLHQEATAALDEFEANNPQLAT
jgi:hypothetical protein